MFEKRSKVLFACALLATIYVVYLIIYFTKSMASSDELEALGAGLATAMVTPHIICMALGAIFSWVGFFLRKTWGALVGAILFCVGTVLFLLYFMFGIPLIILGFVGYANQKKLIKEN